MTEQELRDAFARAAMQSLINESDLPLKLDTSYRTPPVDPKRVRMIAQAAYIIAEAMLHERQRLEDERGAGITGEGRGSPV